MAPTEMEDEVLILNVEAVTRKTPAMVMVLAGQAMLEEAMAFYAMVITSIGKSSFPFKIPPLFSNYHVQKLCLLYWESQLSRVSISADFAIVQF